ncbi:MULTISPECIES: E2/UBC family protein [Pseudoalteromonas]|jgi:molybdopterin/thiamine biosynthesis adenylyltransferase|uniref:E2/UBC family protein n=1 Tax=Pseudoalteromonas TaxID=53246 RepID=UPI0030028E81
MELVHHILLNLEFQFVNSRKLSRELIRKPFNLNNGAYIKEFIVNGELFIIALIIPNDPHIKLPSAYVISMPDIYKDKLIPHISHEGYLCYVEQKEADWDPNDLDTLYKNIDSQIQSTLIKSFQNQSESDSEFENEFVSYWPSDNFLYLLSHRDKSFNFITIQCTSVDEKSVGDYEFITINIGNKKPDEYFEDHELNQWLSQRKLKIDNKNNFGIKTHYVSVSPDKLAGINWPPNNLGHLINWLEEVNCSARDHLIYSLTSKKEKKHILLLDIDKQDPIAVHIELNVQAFDFNRRANKKKKNKISFNSLLAVVRSNKFCNHFKRFSVIKADTTTLQSRDKKRDLQLNSQRVALIGCGTIGGYLASLLIRNGAGCSNKQFDLYDDDILMPHNFSRHVLTSSSFGKNKAVELANNLTQSIHTVKSVHGFASSFPLNENILSKYDIIIDATGRPPFSKRLSHVVRLLPQLKRPNVIHAFNDGNGRASKVLVDIGHSCYKCMTIDKTIHQRNGDTRFASNIIDKSARKVSCGNTYTIYDASVSHITAAIAQEAVLNTLESSLPWSYSEFILDEQFRTGKRRILKRQPECPICYEDSM